MTSTNTMKEAAAHDEVAYYRAIKTFEKLLDHWVEGKHSATLFVRSKEAIATLKRAAHTPVTPDVRFDLRQSLTTAIDYLTACGYDNVHNVDESEPEYQMLQDFKRILEALQPKESSCK